MPGGAGALGLGGELVVGRVGDLLQGQPVRRGDGGGTLARAGVQELARPGDRLASLPDGQARPHQGADHGVAEGVGDDAQGHEPGVRPGLGPSPLQGAQGADGRGALAGLAVGQEVVLAEQRPGAGVHGLDVERIGQPQDGGAPDGVARGGGVRDPVGVAAAQGAETGVKFLRHGARPGDDDVAGPARRARQALLGLAGQDTRHPGEQGGLGEAPGASGQCGPGLGARIEVGHLGGGVDAGVGASGHGEADWLTQHGDQGGGEDPLDSAQPGLGGPPREEGPVVGQVEADAWHAPH